MGGKQGNSGKGNAEGGIFSKAMDIAKGQGAMGFLSGMESISQGNANAQLAAGQAAAAGGGVKTPGVDISNLLTQQDTAARLSGDRALSKFKEARDRKEANSSKAKIAQEVANV